MEEKDMPLATRQGASHPAPVASALVSALRDLQVALLADKPHAEGGGLSEVSRKRAFGIACDAHALANSHAALVKAASAFVERFDSGQGSRADTDHVAGLMRAALALATKET